MRRFLRIELSPATRSRSSHQIAASEDLAREKEPLSNLTLKELKRHHAELCVKIETHERVRGYVLIGSRESGRPYTEEDRIFFEALANDIAIEIEKEEFYRSSHFDPLTGLLNRQDLETRFKAVIAKAKACGSPYGVALVDLDDFKKVNDTYGHRVGDRVLRIAAEILEAGIRKPDLLFRYGGEEFLLILGKNRVTVHG